MDAIALLKADHQTVEDLFTRYEGLGPRASKTRRDLADRVIKELSIHTAIEEAVLYPAIRQAAEARGETDQMVLEALEEHHVAKWTLKELETIDPEHERFDAKMTVLMESIRHHVKEEEGDLFPKLPALLGKPCLADLGEAMAELKKVAPTRPHPKMPDEPPGNEWSAVAASIIDRVIDAGRRFVKTATG